MRTGINFTISFVDRERLETIIADRNSLQKHVKRRAKLTSKSGKTACKTDRP